MIQFLLNDKSIATDQPPGMVMLDFIRYQQNLTGTKIGCREGDCGACTVLVGSLVHGELQYRSMTSCLMPIGNAHGKHIVTIEGINFPNHLNVIQTAMAEEGGTQCGFCTPGFVMSLAGFCLNHSDSENENVIAAIDGNICRCTGYKPIERAAARVATLMKEQRDMDPVSFSVAHKIVPHYFSTIKGRLENMEFDPLESKDEIMIVGGGTDLYVQKHEEMTGASIGFVLDNPALKKITRHGDMIHVGPAATVTDLKNSSVFNEAVLNFDHYSKLVSSTPIRNMATIAGNFINASPIGDLTIFFMALDAQIVLSESFEPHAPTRTVPLKNIYLGYKKLDRSPGENIADIQFRPLKKNELFHFEKVSKRTHLDIASVNTAIRLSVEDNTIAAAQLTAGGVGPVPLYLSHASAFLIGKEVNEQTILELIGVIKKEIAPISDARGSKEYKTLLLFQLLKSHFIKLFPQLNSLALVHSAANEKH